MNDIHSSAYIVSEKVQMGDNNYFAAFCVIGSPPQHRDFTKEYSGVIIGNDNFIREFVVIYCGTFRDTIIGNRNWIMSKTHVGHEVVLENDVVLATGVSIAGNSHIMSGSNIGMGAILHQRTVVGAYSAIGMGTIVTKQSDIRPFMKYVGNPARLLGPNEYAIKKFPDKYKKIEQLNEEFEDLKRER